MRQLQAVAVIALSVLAMACGANDGSGTKGGSGSIDEDTPPVSGASDGARTPGAPGPSRPGSPPDDQAPPTDRALTIADFPGSKLFMPPKTPAPAIVMLHGSEGGTEPYLPELAAEIAKKGFVVLSLCWFGCTGTPAKILRVPLEHVVDAGKWLEGSKDVAGGKVGLFGWSRGAEQAVLVTSLLAGTDPFAAVYVHAASDTVVASYDPAIEDSLTETDPKTGQTIPSPAWTWRGQALFGEPKADYSVPGPRILVEKYPGPVRVSAGERDEVWETARSRRIVAARTTANVPTESHFWPGEGHVIMKAANVTSFHAEIATFFQTRLAP